MDSLIQYVNQWDIRIFGKIFGDSDRKNWLRFFYLLSRSAGSYSCAFLGLFWILVMPETFSYVLAAIGAFAIELTCYYLLKKNIKRPRPCRRIQGVQNLIAPPDEFSFPSGHTAAAFLMTTLVSAAFPALLAPALAWALLVGFSRIYLGVHYPSDVLAGMALGVASALAGLTVFRCLC